MAQSAVKLPPGFVLEGPKAPKLPPGFVLERQSATPTPTPTPPQPQGFNDARSTKDVFMDQSLNVAESLGIAHPIETAKGIWNMATRPASAGPALLNMAKAPFKAAAHLPATVSTAITGAAALAAPGKFQAPSPQEFSDAAHGSGELLVNAPLLGMAPGAVNMARSAASRAGRTIYQKALQPSPRSYSMAQIDAMVKTGLENGLAIGRSGLNKLDVLVNKWNTLIERDIARNPNAPMSPSAVTQRLGPARQRAGPGNQVNPDSDLAAINSAESEFLRHHQTAGTPATLGTPATTDPYTGVTTPGTPGTPAVPAADIPIPATAAQAIKKGTYQQINSKQYGELGSGSVEAQKQLARGLKEELETIFPEIKKMNAKEGELLDLRPELEAAVNRLGDRRISLANVFNVAANPAVTSRLAIILYKAGVPAAQVTTRIAKYTLGLQAMAVAAASQNKPQP